ncbi:MAG TPA: hypothetical protein VIS72_06190 [Anaerolineales bacterium]
MSEQKHPGIYLIVEFDWPRPFDAEVGKKARHLHDIVQGKTWIRESVAASAGIGEGPRSIWVFRLENYAALDRLLRDASDKVSKAYSDFFTAMPRVVDKIREEVIFV